MEKMTIDQMRKRIAESGKMTVKDISDYIEHRWAGQYDKKILKAEAKEIIKESKNYM